MEFRLSNYRLVAQLLAIYDKMHSRSSLLNGVALCAKAALPT